MLKGHFLPVDFKIEDVREAIKGVDEIRELKHGDYCIFSYVVSKFNTFPNPAEAPDERTAFLWAIRRECRGLIMSLTTGEIISRRYHKFFNVDELKETAAELIDFTRPTTILEKLDGSMIGPYIGNGKLIFGTKNGPTSVATRVEEFVQKISPKIDYVGFSMAWIDRGFTPIFEWLSTRDPIVLTYDEDQLILTALRSNRTGEYLSYEEMVAAGAEKGVPVVNKWKGEILKDGDLKFDNFREWMVHMRSKEDIEGYVVRFEDGLMTKLKTEWYFAQNKGLIQNMFASEREIWMTILENKHDDYKAIMKPEHKQALDEFSSKLINNIYETAAQLTEAVKELKKEFPERRDFAKELNKRAPPFSKLYFPIFAGEDAGDVVMEHIKKNLGAKIQLESVRPLAGNIRFDGIVPSKKFGNGQTDSNVNEKEEE